MGRRDLTVPTARQQELIDAYLAWDNRLETVNELCARHNVTRSRLYQVLKRYNVQLRSTIALQREDGVVSEATEKALEEAARRAIRLARKGCESKDPEVRSFVKDELAEIERYLDELVKAG